MWRLQWHPTPGTSTSSSTLLICHTAQSILQLGQPSVNPPRLLLEVGGTSTKQAAMPGELNMKSPPHLEA